MGGTMKRSAFPIRIVGLVGAVALLVLFLARPAGASLLRLQTTPEPTPRETPTPAPYLELNPTRGVAGDATPVTASGVNWQPGEDVVLYWDVVGGHRLADPINVQGNGTFEAGFTTPTDPALATVGPHTVIAVQGGFQAEASFLLETPTATFTPTPTDTPTPRPPTVPPPPTNTKTPTPTSSVTPTLIPSPTLRPVTPMVTISPLPGTKAPVVTKAPVATRTNTPVPGTATNTRTPTITPTPSLTPGPGTPSVTPEPTATPVGEISDTGLGWGTLFLWGFVLAGLVVVFRMLRVRSLPR